MPSLHMTRVGSLIFWILITCYFIIFSIFNDFIFFTIPEGKEGRIVLQNILISGLSSQILTSYPTYLVFWQLHIHNSWTCLISNAFPCTDLCFCALQVEILTWLGISALIWPTVQVFFLISTATDLYLVFFQTWL